MKTHTIALVQASFAKVVPTAHAAAISAFDDSLSRRDPELRALLRGDLGTRGTRLLPMLAFAVNRLGNPDALLPALEKLGRDLPRWICTSGTTPMCAWPCSTHWRPASAMSSRPTCAVPGWKRSNSSARH